MVAVLTRIFGTHNLGLAEDVVQESFVRAMQSWRFDALPDNPEGWLIQVARNRAIDHIRREKNFKNFSPELAAQLQQDAEQTIEQFFSDAEIADSQLRMIFACCHPALKVEDQVALTLKTVSGFGVSEIARALVSTESTIEKRLYRAKLFLKENDITLDIPAGKELHTRLSIVCTVLYLLFNEGYNSTKAEELIRKDLCAEAMRLCLLLTEQPVIQQPFIYALLSLMCFQASRFDSRLGVNNTIILLQQQDRNSWNRELINRGYTYLNRSATGDELTVYHLESAIAAEHCLAASFETTNWSRLLSLYDNLLEIKNTPQVQLNRSIVLAFLQQLPAAIHEIWQIEGIEYLLKSQYIFPAVLGDLYARLGDVINARRYLQSAAALTSSQAEKKLITDKLQLLDTSRFN